MIALTVLLAVTQASPPVPRKATDNPAQTVAQVKSKSASSQAEPSPATATVKTASDGPTKTDSGQYPEDTQHTVGISKLPPVTVTPTKRDWADWAYWGFNCLLAVTGGFQVYLLFRTLRAVNRQAEETGKQVEVTAGQLRAMNEQITEMSVQSGILHQSVMVARDAASAASLSAQTLINSERPWLFITATSTNNQNTAYEFRAANYGRTPLEIIYEKAETRIVSSEGEVPILLPETSRQLLNVQPLLPVIDIADMQQARQMPDWNTISRNIKGFFPMTILNAREQGDKLDVTNSVRYVVVFGIVTYRNVLNGQGYYTRFCYRWNFSGGVILYGPERANEHGEIPANAPAA
jgi:hypothetical protein